MLGPQVFYAYIRPFGLPIDGFFPGYQHQIDVADGTDVNLILIDLFVLKTWRKKTIWMLLDPQIIIDHESNKEFFLMDTEVGLMLEEFTGLKGHSAYVRPSYGSGGDRPYDASFELGYKIVW